MQPIVWYDLVKSNIYCSLLRVFVAALTAAIVTTLITHFSNKYGTEEGRDAITQCQRRADGRYQTCVSAAAGLPSVLAVPVQAACYAVWLLEVAACIL